MILKTHLIMCKEKKQSCSSLYLFGLLMACGILVSACKPNEQKAGAQPPTNAPRDVSKAQSPSASAKPEVNFLATVSKAQEQSLKPKINFVATEKLYKKIKQNKLGSGAGLIKIYEKTGILIHPGVSPTEVTFDVSQMKETLKLAFWIGQFNQEALSLPKAGTAGFEVFVDEKSLGRKRVDRLTNQTLLINPQGLSKLRIVVDNDDGAQTCDWFFMGLQ
jgi:hypothetical protein